MNIAIIGYDLRALSLARVLINEKNNVFVIPGFYADFFENCKSIQIDSNKTYMYEVVREMDKIVFILNTISVDLVICLNVESSDEGLVEYLRKKKFVVFGCNKQGALIETSKLRGLDFAKKSGLLCPNSNFITKDKKYEWVKNNFSHKKIVLKNNGLAGGRGTFIITSEQEFYNEIEKINSDLLIQDFIEGEEVAFSLMINKNSIDILNVNFEIKKEFDGDLGKNTSGMGTVSRNAFDLDKKQIKKLLKNLEVNLRQINYTGALDLSFIINKDNELVFLEFTSRFGNPELQSEILLLKNLTKTFYDNALGRNVNIEYENYNWAVGIVAKSDKDSSLILPSDIKSYNYIIDTLVLNNKTELSISARGNNFLKLLEKQYDILNKSLDNSFYYRRDLDKNIQKRWERFKSIIL